MSVITPKKTATSGMVAKNHTTGFVRAWAITANPYTPPTRQAAPITATVGLNSESYFFQMRRIHMEL